MTITHRLHLFHRLNNKAFYVGTTALISPNGKIHPLMQPEERSFRRVVDWILDVPDNVIYEWRGIGCFVDNLKFRKYLTEFLVYAHSDLRMHA
jgi:hypothetical protein